MIGRLLCRMGVHDADPDGRWNGGYCFTHCRHCGRDMVRSAFGEWHIPKGYRVVWGPQGSVADLDRVLTQRAPPAPVEAPTVVEPASWPRPRRAVAAASSGRSPFDFGDFDDVSEDRSEDAFAPPPERRRRAPPA